MLVDFASTMFEDVVGGFGSGLDQSMDLIAGLFSKSLGSGEPMPEIEIEIEAGTGNIARAASAAGSIAGEGSVAGEESLLETLGLNKRDLWAIGLSGLAGYSQRKFIEGEREKQRKHERDLRRVHYSGGYDPRTQLYGGVIERARTPTPAPNIPQRRV